MLTQQDEGTSYTLALAVSHSHVRTPARAVRRPVARPGVLAGRRRILCVKAPRLPD